MAAGGVITFRDVAGTLRAGAGAPKHESDWEKLICSPISAKWAKGTGGPSGDECQNLVAFACNQRQDKNGPQGSGINEDVSFTLNATDKHAVVYPINTQLVTRGFEGDTARTLTARHDSSPCVDRGQDLVFAIRTAQLYENHAVRSFTSSQFGQYQEGVGTLRSNGGDCGGGSENLVNQNHTVRRLTVIECLRLMGFPDWWFDGVPGYSDTAGYKSCGNSIAVPCISWIMNNIKEVFEA